MGNARLRVPGALGAPFGGLDGHLAALAWTDYFECYCVETKSHRGREDVIALSRTGVSYEEARSLAE